MDSIPKNRILQYHDDTLQYLRNQYGLDTVKRVNEAIDILEDWIKKQEHFEKKNFDRGHLERLIIFNKGSVEKCKKKLDRLCTLRTLIPDFFAIHHFNKEDIFSVHTSVLLPKMTPDYGRVHLLRISGDNFNVHRFNEFAKYFVLVSKYIQLFDYCNHYTIVADWTDINVLNYVKESNLAELRKSCEIAFQGSSMRFNGLHHFSSSKTVEIFIGMMKQFMSPKLGARIRVHKSWDTVFEHIPKEIFPKEYGGLEKSIYELRDDLFAELHSKEFIEYREELNKGRVNEAFRCTDKFNDEYIGVSGTFRTLSVD